MRKIVHVMILFGCLQASAQKTGFQFGTSVQAGLLEGETGGAFQLQTVNGYQYKTWSAGLGVGLDYYHTRSIPLFLSFRKAFGTGAKTPFLYANGGYHFMWLRQKDKYWGETDADGGLYYDAGIGYQLPVLKNSSLFFTAGFSQKNFTRRESDGPVIAIGPAPPPQTRKFEYNLRRLSIQTGLRF